MAFEPPFDTLTCFFAWLSAVKHKEGTRYNQVAKQTRDEVKTLQEQGITVAPNNKVWKRLDDFLAPYLKKGKAKHIKQALTDGNASPIVMELACERTGGPIITKFEGYVLEWQ
jgi:hypothetical protein